ncbi:restriction endonuclease subunit S [Pedobacter cryotolerans]|uniref:Restriction endonuclease subunit S n=1 Tax=Pedobacter cryotolerans TaxID=2571270 RepID=A0A4U1CAC8_9SPHI|nr:restriction endonuclease subunit S [Pedobacter cryotolerans]TKC01409.1 restriction endonuclease subunit S [Pedobacter cryotolerans]
MGKIDDLIAKYCPEGVEYKDLGDIVQILDNKRKPISKGNRIAGKYPYYGANGIQDYVEGYIFDGTFLLLGEDGSVINKDGSPVLNWASGKIWVNNHAHILAENKDKALLRFIYFALAEIDVTKVVKGNIPKITQQNLRSFSIPIPPLLVQQEIVNILDKFTSLTAELEAELEARSTQYVYYRDKLLGFENTAVEWKTLGEVGTFLRGKRFVRTDMIEEGFPCIHYGEMYTHYNIYAKQSKSFISEELASKLRKANPGDVIIVAAGETIEDIGKGTAWLADTDVVTHDACFSFKSPLNPKYVSYFLRTRLFHDQIRPHISSGKISAINANGLSKAKIPVPPRAEQDRIVAILDKFDALVTDISTGLPAEIKARRQQYEYYRGKLLTFN